MPHFDLAAWLRSVEAWNSDRLPRAFAWHDDVAPTAMSTGKWTEPDVPHRGWSCIDVEDLGEPSETCEMCEVAEIRYVHHMEHPDYPETLGVGCICAEHMEEDYVGPRLREKRLRLRARRRKTWARREWRRSYAGNFHLNTEGYRLVVFRHGERDLNDEWQIGVGPHDGSMVWGRRRYLTAEAAQLAGLDALLWAKDQRR